MELSKDAEAILLLTAVFGKEHSGGLKPLTLEKWRKVRDYLNKSELCPGDLLEGDASVLSECTMQPKGPSIDSIRRLLERGLAYASTIYEWEKKGIWIVTYLDDEYPTRLNQRLQDKAPPVLFGVGDKSLLNSGGLAVVGSRNAPDEDLNYAQELGQAAASERITVISGGARGVDRKAMWGALEGGGRAVGILSDDLLKKSMSKDTREYLLEERLVLISPTSPEVKLTRFEFISAAMQRNHYIYCMSDAAVVVHSADKGGTWSGARDNLGKDWVSLWMRDTDSMRSVNDALEEKKKIKAKGKAKFLPKNEDEYAHIRIIFGIEEERVKTVIPPKPQSNEGLDPHSNGNQRTLAVLLLTTQLLSDCDDEVSPLGFKEWGKFAKWLLDHQFTPENLLTKSLDNILECAEKQNNSTDRIRTLLSQSRQEQLTTEIENWHKAGIWILSRGDKDYPKVLKRKLRYDCPAILFGSGDRPLLSQGKKIMVLGSSRGISDIDLNYSRSLAVAVAEAKSVLVSVNRAQIEKDAIESSLDHGGQCIAVLPGGLQKSFSTSPLKKFIIDKKLVSLSALPPSAPPAKLTSSTFKQHHAIAYCLSDAAVIVRHGKNDAVVHSALKCLQSNWVSIWVREQEGKNSEESLMIEGDRQWLPRGVDASRHVQRLLNPTEVVSEGR